MAKATLAGAGLTADEQVALGQRDADPGAVLTTLGRLRA
jgi:hypothetical protein